MTATGNGHDPAAPAGSGGNGLGLVLARDVVRFARALRDRVVGFVQRLRREDLSKLPGVAETVDWAEAIVHVGSGELAPELVDATLGLLLKYHDDIERVRGAMARQLLAESA